MNILQKPRVFLPLLLVVVVHLSLHAAENEWRVEIDLAKHSYVLHEKIWLDVTVTNITSDTVSVRELSTPNYFQFTIDIVDNHGKKLEYTGLTFVFGGGPDRVLLSAGEQQHGSLNLMESYGLRDGKSGYPMGHWALPYIPVGTYTIQINIEGEVSNDLTFDIVEPFGDEKEVVELIEKAISSCYQDNTDAAASTFQEVVDRFPGSVFAETCFFLSRFYSPDIRDAKDHGRYDPRPIKRELIQHYPDSRDSKGWLWSITRELDHDETVALLNQFIEKNPNTRVHRFAKQMRDRLVVEKTMK